MGGPRLSRRRALIELDPDDPPLLVERIPDFVTLPLCATQRDVHLSHERFTHIVQRRILDGDAQVALVLRRMVDVIREPTHIGLYSHDGSRFCLYAWNFDDPAGVAVNVKCLSAETWVQTAFPVGTRTLMRYLGTKRLLPIPR